MDEVGTKIVEILKKHMKEPRDDISLSTPLTDPYNANEDVEDFKTVGSVVDRVKDLMAKGPAAAGAKA